MSRICSKVQSLNDLIFEPITAKPVAVTKVVNVNGTIVAVDANNSNKIHTTGVVGHCAYSFHDEDGSRIGRVLAGCIKLRVLSAGAVKKHQDHVSAGKAARDLAWNTKQFLDYAKTLGPERSTELLEVLKNDHE